jgi:protoporphyrinogen oxidase
MQKVAVVGGGPGGLTFAFELLKNNRSVQIDLFNADGFIGGLASNSRQFADIEMFYHHIFKSDKSIRKLCKELNFSISWKRLPVFNLYDSQALSSADSAKGLIDQLGFTSFIRLLFGVIMVKITPRSFWMSKDMEVYLSAVFGKKSAQSIWIPLLRQKFQASWKEIDFAWLASRIADRSVKLGFVEGGFGAIWNSIQHRLLTDPNFRLVKEKVSKIENVGTRVSLVSQNGKIHKDYSFVFASSNNIFSQSSPSNGVECLILQLAERPALSFYWLNLLGLNTNFTVFINHSLALSNTGLEHEYGYVYLARYVPADNLKNDDRKRESIAKEQAKLDLAKIFSANNLDTPEVLGIEYNSSHVAQPIFAPENISHEKNKREILLSRNVFLSDMWATFPHDRGQNYACLNATNAAEFINDMLNLVER